MANVKRLFCVGACALGLAWSAAARAGDCSAQTGKTIFEDTFKDASGGFEQDDQAKFGATGLLMTVSKTEDGWAYVTGKTAATNGDYCTVATMTAPVAADNLAAVGLTVLYADDDDMVAIYVFSDNTVQIEQRSKGDSKLILNEQNPDIKAAAGTTVSIRAVLQDGAITAYVNGIAFQKVSVQMPLPQGAERFGPYVRLDKEAGKEVTFTFKSLRVAAGDEGKK